MSFVNVADEITLESLTKEQFECFIEYYHENYLEDFKRDLENPEEIYKMMNGGVEYPRIHSTPPSETYASCKPSSRLALFEQPSCLGSTFVSDALWKSDQMHQTFEKSSLAMTHKLDDMIELPKSQFKKTYKEELEIKIAKVKIPKCMSWEIPSVDEPEPQLLPKLSPLDVNLGDKRGTNPPINPYVWVILRWSGVEYPRTQSTSPSETYTPCKPSPWLDLFDQPSCLGSTFVSEALWKSNQMHQTFEKSSLAMTHKLDDMIELPKSQSKKTYKDELECEIVLVKIPKCMSWLDARDEPIGDLDMTEDKVDNPCPQSTP
uniref:Uncharacterized protein n=1 Tax=Tanacetum cinerariifolium TaxID=118510 RepID=A0A6L2KU24_TANCI|nr:hypothetical protein [Tanacetum cinerariifolium]